MSATCSVDGCDRRAKGRGMCNMHYQRQRRHGSTDDHTHTSHVKDIIGTESRGVVVLFRDGFIEDGYHRNAAWGVWHDPKLGGCGRMWRTTTMLARRGGCICRRVEARRKQGEAQRGKPHPQTLSAAGRAVMVARGLRAMEQLVRVGNRWRRKPKTGRPRQHASDADRQREYRRRQNAGG